MINFEMRSDCQYKHDYGEIFRDLALKESEVGKEAAAAFKRQVFRQLTVEDLFFIVCFVMGIEKANHPFVVDACLDVERGPVSGTLDVWAREHFKSTVITLGETIQYHLDDGTNKRTRFYGNCGPECCTGIFAYVRPVSKAFLRGIKNLFETSDLLKWCFPDILWQNPASEAPKWSEDDGLILKRKSASRKESSIEAWGLIEGMPTSRHFDRRIYDDIETHDIAENPDMLNKCYSKFEMSDNLGVDGGIERIIGTFYSNFGPIKRIQDKTMTDGTTLMYHTRLKPATHDGTRDGKPVLLSPERIEKLKTSQHFESQQLCDPTPAGDIKLNPADLRPIEPEFIPKGITRFMVVDQAGDDDENQSKGDLWAMGTFGVKAPAPKRPGQALSDDEIGAADIYILDLDADQMSHSQAIETIVNMYLRGGIIRQLGIEKVGLSTTEIHIANALKMKGRRVSKEAGNLFLLKPGGRALRKRVEGAVQWPLCNGKIYYSTAIDPKVIQRLKFEMEKFPFYHSDILNIIAYLYDMLKECKFLGSGEGREVKQEGIFYR